MNSDPYIAIGLEVHVQVKTRTKAFCSCPVEDTEPNSAICPTCLGQPGALPAPNKEMISKALKLACAVDASVNLVSRFARKHYLYPDLPKGYQITQFNEPLAFGGRIPILSSGEQKTIRLRRIHVEEDAAKLIHNEPWLRNDRSYVDFNRCGIPLIEVVTEPVLRTGREAVQFVRALQRLLTWLEISEARPESGQIRVDANVSIRLDSDEEPVITEIKNLNSFTGLRQSVDFEITNKIEKRRTGAAENAETVLWDECSRETRTMRSKESLSDYRYIPDPDLPVLRIHEHEIRNVEESIPELPWEVRKRFMASHGIALEHADRLTQSREIASFFERTVNCGAKASTVVQWMMGELRHLQKCLDTEDPADLITPESLAGLLVAEQEGRLTNAGAKDILFRGCYGDGSVEAMMDEYGSTDYCSMEQIRDAVAAVLEGYETVVKAVRSGSKPGGIDFLIGNVLKKLSGAVAPQKVREEIFKYLGMVDNEHRETYHG